jgi:hypothetical protein
MEIVQHPVMVQFINLLRGIYESKDVPAMVAAMQAAQQVLLSPAFSHPVYSISGEIPEGVDPVTGEIL